MQMDGVSVTLFKKGVDIEVKIKVYGDGDVMLYKEWISRVVVEVIILDGRPSVAETFTPSLIENIGKLLRMLHSWNVLSGHAA